MKNLLKKITKTYELKQVEAYLDKTENLKTNIQASYMLMPNSLMR